MIGEKMDVTLKEVLQNGKAHSNMKKVWAIRWMIGFWFLFIFLMIIIGIGFLDFIINSGIIGIVFYYLILPIILGLIVAYGWASLYWNNYSFEVGPEKITITRGVIGKRVVNIPYERVQNVNIWRGVLDRIFGIYAVQIETAGGFSAMSSGGYGTRMAAEGSIQGLINPEPIADYIIAKSKGKETLSDKTEDKTIDNADKIRLLEERLLRGEISEKTYEELKKKYG
jgi:uncharacterized membrane protein YdbT with pleckstrin-like domain